MFDFDYVIIGSGFGGSVSALRLSEKGYKVLVIEKGKWYHSKDFPKTNKNLKRWLWLPSLRFFGIFKITFLRHIGVLSGVGVGGGSLVYANTLPLPKSTFFKTGSWSKIRNWQAELEPFYNLAKEMLGVASNPYLGDADVALQEVANDVGRGDHFKPTDVAVFFGESGKEVSDPYFDGLGPARSGCNFCGACMTGCRYGAKNSLDKNYLYLAQKLGAEILAKHKVYDVKEEPGNGYRIWFKSSTRFIKKRTSISTKGVIFAGGVLGTVKLLLKLRRKSLLRLSKKVGDDIRTNNESLIGIASLDKKRDFSKGIAIGSIVSTDENSHLEAVRYGYGSTFWRFMMLPQTSGNNPITRVFTLFLKILRSPIRYLRIFFMGEFSTKAPILLFMQHLDSTLRFSSGWFGLRSSPQEGKKPTSFLPEARALADSYAQKVNGEPFVAPLESLFGVPTTAHILGGAVMGKDRDHGVIDQSNHVFGYENMLVCDGSMISANPGVNPSLTITAITERAMSLIPDKS